MASSLARLSDRLAEVGCLVDICRSRRVRKTANINQERPALLRSGIVILSSHIEGFFEELIDDILEGMDAGIQITSDFPREVRIRQVIQSAGKWQSSDINKIWDNVRDCSNAPLLVDGAAHTAGLIDSALHTGSFANPGTGEIKTLFRSIGIDDVWANFSLREPQIAYKNEIDAIVSRRNQIAHGDMGAQITENDLSVYIQNFSHTASIFANLSKDHVTTYVPGFAWP